jgi:hypothetical protein
VVEGDGNLVNVITTSDITMSTDQKDIRFEAATTNSFTAGTTFSITAVSGANLKTTSDSESDFVIRYVVGCNSRALSLSLSLSLCVSLSWLFDSPLLTIGCCGMMIVLEVYSISRVAREYR